MLRIVVFLAALFGVLLVVGTTVITLEDPFILEDASTQPIFMNSDGTLEQNHIVGLEDGNTTYSFYSNFSDVGFFLSLVPKILVTSVQTGVKIRFGKPTHTDPKVFPDSWSRLALYVEYGKVSEFSKALFE